MKFSEKLTRLRKAKGMSQEELAEKLEISRQAVSRWELGATMPDAGNLLQLSDLFQVSTDYLLRDRQENPPFTQEIKTDKMPSQDKETRRHLIAFILWLIGSCCFLLAAGISGNGLFVIVGLMYFCISCLHLHAYRKRRQKQEVDMRKIFILFLVVLVVAALLFLGTGFLSRSNVVLVDYSVSGDGTMYLQVGITTSMGYTRGFRAEEKGNECYLTFLSTFGGLNSPIGAKSQFALTVEPDWEAIYFCIGNGEYQQVLIKENGQWNRAK